MEALIARYSSPHDDFFDNDEDDTAQFTTTIPAKGGCFMGKHSPTRVIDHDTGVTLPQSFALQNQTLTFAWLMQCNMLKLDKTVVMCQ
jgi:hypothetical protein